MAKKQVKDIKFGGLSNNMDESLESEGNAWQSFNTWHDKGILEGIRRYITIGQRSGASASDVSYGMGYGKSSGNEQQKLTITGAPTGGTVKLTFQVTDAALAAILGVANNTTFSSVSTFSYSNSASTMYAYLQTLVSGGVYAFLPGDISVTGGPWPGVPMVVDFQGRYTGYNVEPLVLATNSLTGGTTPSVTITEVIKGGEYEVVYTVVKHSGDTDSNLYAVTSTDGFATTTWTSLSTSFDSSDWFFEQYDRRMFMANSIDGLKYVYIGSSTLLADPPSPPSEGPTFGGPFSEGGLENLGTGCSYSQSGFTTPTMSAVGSGAKILFNTSEDGVTGVVTITLASDPDFSARDFVQLQISQFGCQVVPESMKIHFINADGSPVTYYPLANGNAFTDTGSNVYRKYFQLAGNVRYSRDNTHKVVITFALDEAPASSFVILFYSVGSNWMNDTLAMDLGPPPLPVKSGIEYAMSYYRVSDGGESALSPSTTSQSVPTSIFGNYQSVNGYGSTQLGATDMQFFYRKEKATQKWRRIPNVWTKSTYQITDYGVTNDPTGASDGQYDHWMEYELSSFPEYSNIGFNVTDVGHQSDIIGVWKQCLAVGAGKVAALSWVGQPLKYEPSPDKQGYISPDPVLYPDVGVTEYVSDNRSENVLALIGQDSLYAVTALSAYAKVGDSPATASVFRRLPGSRGALSKRSVYRYGGGILIGSQDGLWYYSVGRGFSGEDNGALVEREETGGSATTGAPGVRRSYQRLLSELHSIELTGTGLSGTFDLTWKGYTATIPVTATALDVQRALEGFTIVSPGDFEVFGEDLVDADGNASGTMYIRYLGRYAASTQSTYDGGLLRYVPDMTGSVANVDGTDEAISLSVVTRGESTNLIVFEFNDEYWLFNQKSWLHQSRSRKWSEGVWLDSIKAVVANRERGVLMLSTTGRLLKLTDGVGTDSGGLVKWQYESPWMTGPRARVLSVYSVTQGAPTFRLYSDDGAGSVDTYDANSPHTMTVELDEGRFTPLPASNLPGVRHKIIVSGVCGRDKVKYLGLGVQPDGTDQLGS